MKTTGKCPKCAGTNIKAVDHARNRGHVLGSTRFSNISPTLFVCADCGFAEDYFDPEDLKTLEYAKSVRQT